MNLNINDIAKLANVSKATVSRVINGTGQVSEKTRQAVMEVVEKYNYHPNSFAQAISTQSYQSNYIAVAVPHSEAYIMSNPVYAELFRGIADVLTPRGYFMLSCFTNDTEHIKNLYLQRRVDGYIILSPTTNDYDLLRTLHDIDAPFISTTSVTFAEGQKPFHVPYVDIDNYTAAVMAMEHLVGLGHQRIAFLATNENTSRQGKLASILLRQKAYADTLAAHGIVVEPQRIRRRGEQRRRGRLPNRLYAVFRSAGADRRVLRDRPARDRRTQGHQGPRPHRAGRCLARRLRRYPLGALHRSSADHCRAGYLQPRP